ncbi:MAG: CapA family protein [Clostridia bacterium]|nr:CapA family protein [Clostridia bacterium]
MRFTAVGDALIQCRIQSDYAGISELKPYIMQGDARFFNLETTLNREGECFASQFSGGTYLRADPEVLDDLKLFGFNLTTFNNNHAMDFSYAGLLSTLKSLNASGFAHCGVGEDLEKASAPCYLDTDNGRVALVSVNSSFDPSMLAGKKSRVYPGRPGVNGIRLDRVIKAPQEDIDYIRSLAASSLINVEDDDSRAAGYLPPLPEGVAQFGEYMFTLSDRVEICETVKQEDLNRVKATIDEANANADYTIISFHTHNMDSKRLEDPPRFNVDFAHWCVDNGANAFICHGPHLLRPIEVYKDSPIFYSLGDFILELYSVPSAPEDFYAKYGLTSESSVEELLKTRSRNYTIGLMEDERMLRTVIPFWETENRKLKRLELLPVFLIKNGKKQEIGLPRIAKDTSFMNGLADMSKPFGVDIKPTDKEYFTCEW